MKRKKKTKRQKYESNVIFYFTFGKILFIIGLVLFMVGFHNQDLGQNMRWLDAKFNITLVDTATNGKTYTYAQGIIMGVRQMFIGFVLTVGGAALYHTSLSHMRVKDED